MTSKLQWRVRVDREGEAFVANVVGLEGGASTWAMSLRALDEAVRELIAVNLDLPEGAEVDLSLSWDFGRVGGALGAAAGVVERRRSLLAEAEEVAAQVADLVPRLADDGFTVRDIAVVTGLSPARVSQIERASRAVV